MQSCLRQEEDSIRFFEPAPFVYSQPTWRLSVEYTGGYGLPGWFPAATPALPTAIVRSAILMTQQLYEMVGGSAADLTQERLGDYTQVFASSGRRMSSGIVDLLMPYRRMTVG